MNRFCRRLLNVVLVLALLLNSFVFASGEETDPATLRGRLFAQKLMTLPRDQQNRILKFMTIGETVDFGRYFHPEGNETEEISWVIMDTDESGMKVMLVSRYILDSVAWSGDMFTSSRYFNDSINNVSDWLYDQISAWLTPQELDAIAIDPVNGYEKRISLMNRDQYRTLIGSGRRISEVGLEGANDYAKMHRTVNNYWWLLPDQEGNGFIADEYGNLITDYTTGVKSGIRPVVWLDITSEFVSGIPAEERDSFFDFSEMTATAMPTSEPTPTPSPTPTTEPTPTPCPTPVPGPEAVTPDPDVDSLPWEGDESEFSMFRENSANMVAVYTGNAEYLSVPSSIDGKPVHLIGNLFYNSHPDHLKGVRFGEGVYEILQNCFSNERELSVVVLPQTLRTIGANVFEGCESLKSLVIPPSVVNISDRAFGDGDPATFPVLIVTPGSYAEEYCIRKGLRYNYLAGADPIPEPTEFPFTEQRGLGAPDYTILYGEWHEKEGDGVARFTEDLVWLSGTCYPVTYSRNEFQMYYWNGEKAFRRAWAYYGNGTLMIGEPYSDDDPGRETWIYVRSENSAPVPSLMPDRAETTWTPKPIEAIVDMEITPAPATPTPAPVPTEKPAMIRIGAKVPQSSLAEYNSDVTPGFSFELLSDQTGMLYETMPEGVIQTNLTWDRDGTVLVLHLEDGSGSTVRLDFSGGAAEYDFYGDRVTVTAPPNADTVLPGIGAQTVTAEPVVTAAPPEEPEPAEPEDLAFSDWVTAYYNFTAEEGYRQSADQLPALDPQNPPRFAFYDMNRDGVPEIIVFNGFESHADASCFACTFRDGRVVFLGYAGGETGTIYYYPDSGYPGLFYADGWGGSNLYCYSALKDTGYERIEVASSDFDIDTGSTVWTSGTDDEALVSLACSDAERQYLIFHTAEELREMGPEAFVSYAERVGQPDSSEGQIPEPAVTEAPEALEPAVTEAPDEQEPAVVFEPVVTAEPEAPAAQEVQPAQAGIPIPGRSDVVQVPVSSVDASSFVRGKTGTDYMPVQMIDGAETTSYQFSTKKTKLGKAWITFTFESPVSVDALWIKNGFWRITNGLDQYTRNSRVKEMEVSWLYAGAADYTDAAKIRLKDDKKREDWTRIDLGRHDQVVGIRFRILSIYKGTKFKTDVCISEVMFVRNAD